LSEPETYMREVTALEEAVKFFGVNDLTIITKGEERTISEVDKEIYIIPAWKWFVGMGKRK
jgi:predicted AAA+ superfamily ATPase